MTLRDFILLVDDDILCYVYFENTIIYKHFAEKLKNHFINYYNMLSEIDYITIDDNLCIILKELKK